MLRLDINLFLTIINLIIFYLLMKKFLFGPILAVMEKRKNMIDNQIKNANETEQKANELKGKYEDTLQSAHLESGKIMKMAQDNAKAEYDRIIEDAGKKADKILDNAQKKIETEREKTMQEIQSQVAGLAMAAAMKIVSEKGNEGTGKSLYDQFITKAGESNESGVH